MSKAYQERVGALVRAVVKKHGLEHRYNEVPEREGKPVWPVQAELWPGAGKQARTA